MRLFCFLLFGIFSLIFFKLIYEACAVIFINWPLLCDNLQILVKERI